MYMIRYNMHLEISVTGQCWTSIYLAWHFVKDSKNIIVSVYSMEGWKSSSPHPVDADSVCVTVFENKG